LKKRPVFLGALAAVVAVAWTVIISSFIFFGGLVGELFGTAVSVFFIDGWNSGWDVFKQCQPCKAYDLGNQGGGYRTMYYENGNTYDEYNEAFSCRDDADYTSVNQCMKFATHTKMFGANFRDVGLASDQGTITEINMLGDYLGSGGVSYSGNFSTEYDFYSGQLESLEVSPESTHWFLSSVVALAACLVAFIYAQKAEKQQDSSAREPLVS
jgi:hypothetical protein